jgi:hypothetical protein
MALRAWALVVEQESDNDMTSLVSTRHVDIRKFTPVLCQPQAGDYGESELEGEWKGASTPKLIVSEFIRVGSQADRLG